jgi:hypothetical protein
MKPARLAVLLLVYVAFASLPACAEVFTGDVHTTVTVLDTQFWSGINVADGQSVEYTVKVQSGDMVNVHLMDDTQLYLFLAGSAVPTVHSNEDTTSASYTHSTAGKYALVIDNGYGTSVCKVDIVVRSANFWDTGTGCAVIIVVLAIVGVAVVVAIVVVVRRRRTAPAPQYPPQQQYPAAPQYPAPAPSQYPAHPQQYPAAPSPQYPAPPPAAYEAPRSAGYASSPSPGYQAPPPPPQMPPPAPQPPAQPGPAGGQPALCKYCDFQMPAGTQICPRCGGFN